MGKSREQFFAILDVKKFYWYFRESRGGSMLAHKPQSQNRGSMRLQIICFLILTGMIGAQEPGLEVIVKTAFPVRLTPEEEAEQDGTTPSSDQNCRKSCSEPDSAPCTPKCCSNPKPLRCTPKCCNLPNNNCPTIAPPTSCEQCWRGPYFSIDWLFWETRQGGMQYATEYSGPLFGDMLQAQAVSLDFGWTAGWRVGAGYDSPFDNWDFRFDFSRICPKTKSHVVSDAIFPYLMYQGNINALATTVVHEASAKWEISFNTWDFEFGRKILTSDHFDFRPHIGLKGAWIDQKASVDYFGGPAAPAGRYDIDLKNEFHGFGLRGGLDSTWRIGYGFSISGNLAGALLWGSFHVKQSQTLLDQPSIDLSDKFKDMKPMMEASLGLSWDRRYYCDRFLIGIDAALETQYWWGQNIYDRFASAQLPTSVKTVYDLGFFGLTLGIRFGF